MESGEAITFFMQDQVSIFSIPEMPATRLMQARSWSEDHPEWQGKLTVLGSARSGECEFQFQYSDGSLFGSTTIGGYPSPWLRAVTDSSRYFVILMNKFPNASSKVQAGLGFFKREQSNELLMSLQSFFEKPRPQRHKRPSETETVEDVQLEHKRFKPPAQPVASKSEKGLRCSKCSALYKYEFQRRHHEAHQHEKKIQCPCCSSVLKKRFRLYKHIEQCHKQEVKDGSVAVKCQKCAQQFLTETEYNIHLPIHQNPRLGCPFCVDWNFLCYNAASKELGLQQYDQHVTQVHPEVFEVGKHVKSGHQNVDVPEKRMSRKEQRLERQQKLQPAIEKGRASDRGLQDGKDGSLKVCIRCDGTFSTTSLLTAHVRQQHPEESRGGSPMIVSCEKCSSKFTSPRSLGFHCYNKHKELDCPLCDSWSDTIGPGRGQNIVLNSFVEHVKGAHLDMDGKESRNAKLSATGSFTTDDFLPDGYEYLSGQMGMFRCYKCPSTYKNHKALRRHWLIVHKLRQTCFCFICHLPFPAPGQLRHHIFEIHGLLGNVDDHSQFTMDKAESNCHLCTEKFDFYLDLMTHVRRQHHTPENPVIIKCEVCSQRFLKATDYRLHLERHQQNLGCPICTGWSFSGPKGLGFRFLVDHIIDTHAPKPSKFPKRNKNKNAEEATDEETSAEESGIDEIKRDGSDLPEVLAAVSASKSEAPVTQLVQQIPGNIWINF